MGDKKSNAKGVSPHLIAHAARFLSRAFCALGMPLIVWMVRADTWTDAAGYTWTYRINGKGAEINATISPKPTGAVTIPATLGGKSVTDIGDFAFQGCSGLTSVTMPSSVTHIWNGAFHGCGGLTNVTISNGVTGIWEGAFHGCGKLTSVTIPNSVTDIEKGAFSDCGGLMSFVVAAGNPSYKSVLGLLLTKDGKVLVAGVNGDVRIPDGVKKIEDWAFCGLR